MADFSQLMAQMIAAARPPQAPSPSHPAVLGGGGVMGSLGGKSSQIRGAIDPGPWMRLFGYKSPEEKKKIGEQIVASRANYSDEEWSNYVYQEFPQTYLESALKAGVPGIIEEGRTSLGRPRYNALKTTEEAMLRGLGKEQILARGGPSAEKLTAGLRAERGVAPTEVVSGIGVTPEQRESYFLGQERIAKAQQPPSEISILRGDLGPETAKLYIANKRALEEPQLHPTIKDLHQSSINFTNAQADELREAVKTNPDRARAAIKLANAEADLKLTQKRKIEQEYRESEASSIGHLTPEERTGIVEANKAYDGAVRAVEQRYGQAYNLVQGKGNFKTEFERLMTVGGLTEKHLASTDPIVNPPGTSIQNRKGYPISAANLQFFTQQTVEYITNIIGPIEETKGIVFTGPSPQRQEAEQKMIQLMNKVVQLHSQYWSTPASRAVAQIYTDALDAFKAGRREEALMLLGLRKQKGK